MSQETSMEHPRPHVQQDHESCMLRRTNRNCAAQPKGPMHEDSSNETSQAMENRVLCMETFNARPTRP